MTEQNISGSQEKRVASIEEDAAFTDHKVGQLETMVNELSAQVYELVVHVSRLEKRLNDMQTNQQDVPNDPPPHSHRPA